MGGRRSPGGGSEVRVVLSGAVGGLGCGVGFSAHRGQQLQGSVLRASEFETNIRR